MLWTPAVTKLRAALDAAFDPPGTIGMVLDDAGIPRARINVQAPPAQESPMACNSVPGFLS
jgi:hypothetical protein